MVYRAPVEPDEGDIFTGTRQCVVCLERSEMSNFHWASKTKGIRQHRCKACGRTRAALSAELSALVGEEDAKKRRRSQRLLAEYGLTEAGFLQLVEMQKGKCAICEDPLAEIPYVDHDHETNEVRGLLCVRCNTGIGHLRDDVSILLAAVWYLKRPLPDVDTLPRERTPEEQHAYRSAATKRSWETRRMLNQAKEENL